MDRIYVMQLVQSYQAGKLTRREFARRAALALGSVAAANVLLAACVPVSPAPPPVVAPEGGTVPAPGGTVPPPAEATTPGVTAETVSYAGPDGAELMGYLARPEAEGTYPGVIVLQEWWGVDDHIKDVTRRFAQEGFVALAPDLYHGVVTTEPDEARKLVMELDMEAAVQEIGAAAEHLLSLDAATGETVGVVGFCMGGRLALMTAASPDVNARVGAVVPFYGSPLDATQAAQVKAPLLGLYGEADQGIPVAEVRAMEEVVSAAGTPVEIHVYAGAPHAFFNDARASSYNAEAAADAWPRVLAWLRENLG
jgi:carboxymethylenebutenolidase